MRKLQRSEIVDYQTYGESRDAFRQEVMAHKAPRRVHVGEFLTFLFETRQTVRYQVQEMMRAERIVRENDIQHELDTYNELLGGDGELGCTLLIEIDDQARRDQLLRSWIDLPRHLYVETEGGSRVRPERDERQVGTDRLSSVQYLKFPVQGAVPVGIGVDHPELSAHAALSAEQKAALIADLGDS